MISVAIAGPGLSGKTSLIEAIANLLHGSVREDDSRWRWFRRADVRIPGGPKTPAFELSFSHLGGNHYHPWLEYCREHVPSCDVILFVLDSQRDRMPANHECFDAVRSSADLRNRRGLLLYTKRDTLTAVPVDTLNEAFNFMGWPWLASHPGSAETARWVVDAVCTRTQQSGVDQPGDQFG